MNDFAKSAAFSVRPATFDDSISDVQSLAFQVRSRREKFFAWFSVHATLTRAAALFIDLGKSRVGLSE